MSLSDLESRVLASISEGDDERVAFLERLVGESSFTEDKDGVNRVGSLMEDALMALGFRTADVVTGKYGRTLVARRFSDTGHRLLLIGHLDTVHRESAEFAGVTPDSADQDRLKGPGVADMKGGLVVLVSALKALHEAGELEGRQITVVLCADEEVGSPTSADVVSVEAQDAHLALGFEPGQPRDNGASSFVTARRGFGRLELHARGKAAHAGVAPQDGASAILELAHKVIAFSALNDPSAGRSVTVGLIEGGEAANTVPELAHLTVDYRFDDEDDGVELEDEISLIAGRHELTTEDGRSRVGKLVRDKVRRPPMVPTEATERMRVRVLEAGADLGLSLLGEPRGGSSDAAVAAAAGCPALCGMGAVGDRFHTKEEWVSRKSLTERARLAALIMLRFFRL